MMKELSRGDRVKFLNDSGAGTVTRLIDREMVMVRTDDGFEYPVLRSELIITAVEDKQENVPLRSVESEPTRVGSVAAPAAVAPGSPAKKDLSGPVTACMLIVPHSVAEPVGGEADIFLVNDSPYHLLYHASVRLSETIAESISAGILEPDTKMFLGVMHLDDLFSKKRCLSISIIPFGYGKQPVNQPVYQDIKPSHEFILSRSTYTTNDYVEEDAYVIPITGNVDMGSADNLARMIGESMSSVDHGRVLVPRPVVPKQEKRIEEVDLHIGEIIEDSTALSSGEIINIQLARFRTSLEGAIIARQRKIVFIHGSGEGKLKVELRRILDREYPRCRYQDASFREYGYGATLVLLG